MPLKIGASDHERETPRSQPNAPHTAYAVLSGSTLAASMLAPNSPTPNRMRAFGPASGSSARAASSAVSTRMPLACSVAPVETMMKMAMIVVSSEPRTTSVRSAG